MRSIKMSAPAGWRFLRMMSGLFPLSLLSALVHPLLSSLVELKPAALNIWCRTL